MPVIAEATSYARLLARRGAGLAAVVLGASFHPLRTARDGASMVRGLVSPPEEPIPPAPTDAAPASTQAPDQPATPPDADPAPDAAAATGSAAAADVRVEPRGPAPHIPPRIAGEVERDYGDDLPGIRNAEG
jgi:hypothetical protein